MSDNIFTIFIFYDCSETLLQYWQEILKKSVCCRVFWTLNFLFICFCYGYILEMMWVTFSSQTWQNYMQDIVYKLLPRIERGELPLRVKRYIILLIFYKPDSRHCLKYPTWSDDKILTILFIVSVSFWLDDTINWTFHFDPKFGQDYLSP